MGKVNRTDRKQASKSYIMAYDAFQSTVGVGERSDTKKATISHKFDDYRVAGFKYGKFVQKSTTDHTIIFQAFTYQVKDALKLSAKNASQKGSGTDITFPSDLLSHFNFKHEQKYNLIQRDTTNHIPVERGFVEFVMELVDPVFALDVPTMTISIPSEDADRHEKKKVRAVILSTSPLTYESEARRVQRETEQNYRTLIGNQPLFEKSQLTGLTIHTDHRFSIAQGKRYRVPVRIISHWTNLEYLTKTENLSKGAHCSKSFRSLIEDYCNAEGKTMSERLEVFKECDASLAIMEGA